MKLIPQRKEGTPLSLERAHEIFHGLLTKSASIRHEVNFRFRKICEVLGIPTETALEQAQC